MERKNDCLICGKSLTYLKNTENRECYYCHDTFETLVTCTDKHFICDRCHSLPANDLIEQTCINSNLKNPLELALILMREPVIKMHGPEHHFLVPAVLLATYYNTKNESGKREEKIKEVRRRSEKILGGFCGSHGICGAAVGNGIFISLITNTTPLSEKEWRLSNQITAKTLLAIANQGGPRCCKRGSFISIVYAVDFLRKHLGVSLSINQEFFCEFSEFNNECKTTDCKFYRG